MQTHTRSRTCAHGQTNNPITTSHLARACCILCCSSCESRTCSSQNRRLSAASSAHSRAGPLSRPTRSWHTCTAWSMISNHVACTLARCAWLVVATAGRSRTRRRSPTTPPSPYVSTVSFNICSGSRFGPSECHPHCKVSYRNIRISASSPQRTRIQTQCNRI